MDELKTLSNQDTDLELYQGEAIEARPDATDAAKIMTDMRYFDEGERNIIIVGDSGNANFPLFFQKVNNQNPRDGELTLQLGHASVTHRDERIFWQFRRRQVNDQWSGWSTYECSFLGTNGVLRISRDQLSTALPDMEFRCTNTSETAEDAPRLLYNQNSTITVSWEDSMVRKVGLVYLADVGGSSDTQASIKWNTYTGTPGSDSGAINPHKKPLMMVLSLGFITMMFLQ